VCSRRTQLLYSFCSAYEVTILRHYTNIFIFYFLGRTSTKPQAEILKLNNVNGCDNISFSDHSILEGDRIPPLKSHSQASCHAPAVSMANGQMWVLAKLAYLSVLLCELLHLLWPLCCWYGTRHLCYYYHSTLPYDHRIVGVTHCTPAIVLVILKELAIANQVAQLLQRDHTVGWVSYGQKWNTGTRRQYFMDIIGLYLQPLWCNWWAKQLNLVKKTQNLRAIMLFKVIEVGINRKPVCNFPLVIRY